MSSTLSTVIDELSCSRRARDRRDMISSTSSTNSHAASRRSRTGKRSPGLHPGGGQREREIDEPSTRRYRSSSYPPPHDRRSSGRPQGRADDASHDSSSIACSTVCRVDSVGRRDGDRGHSGSTVNGAFVPIGGDRTVAPPKWLKRRRLSGFRRTVCTDHRSCADTRGELGWRVASIGMHAERLE